MQCYNKNINNIRQFFYYAIGTNKFTEITNLRKKCSYVEYKFLFVMLRYA
jgi:hypothetical protein